VLHVAIGLGNYVLDSFFDFTDERVKNISTAEIVLCNSYLLSEASFNDTIAKELEYNDNDCIDLIMFQHEFEFEC